MIIGTNLEIRIGELSDCLHSNLFLVKPGIWKIQGLIYLLSYLGSQESSKRPWLSKFLPDDHLTQLQLIDVRGGWYQ